MHSKLKIINIPKRIYVDIEVPLSIVSLTNDLNFHFELLKYEKTGSAAKLASFSRKMVNKLK